MSNPWFRLYSKIVTDPKIEYLSFEDQRHFVWLLCMKNDGYLDEIYPNSQMRDRTMSRKLGLQGEAFDSAKERLIEVGLIDENWHPLAWNELQFKSDQDPTRADRQQRFRDKKKLDKSTTSNMKRKSNGLRNATVTRTEQNRTDTEQNIKNIVPFETFWENYPKKDAKKDAQKAWSKVKDVDRDKAIDDCRTRYKQTDRQFMPLPATYLNGARWNDENPNAPKQANRDLRRWSAAGEMIVDEKGERVDE